MSNGLSSVINGLRIKEMGAGGIPLLLLHGLAGDLTSWTLNQRVLAADRRVIAVELPGHGESLVQIGDGSAPVMSALLDDVLNALNSEEFHILGLSFGGGIAIDLAYRHRSRVRSLIGVAAAGLGEEINIEFIRSYLAAEDPETMRQSLNLLFHRHERINDAMVGYGLLGRRDRNFRQRIETMVRGNFRNGRQRFSYVDRLIDLGKPRALIWGQEDRIVPIVHARRLAHAVPLHVFEDTGHMPNVEAADRFNSLVRRLLRQWDEERSGT